MILRRKVLLGQAEGGGKEGSENGQRCSVWEFETRLFASHVLVHWKE